MFSFKNCCTSCWDFYLGVACKISSVALTDNIFDTSECFLSKAVNYMHSRASFRDKISRLKRERFLSKNEIAPLEIQQVKMFFPQVLYLSNKARVVFSRVLFSQFTRLRAVLMCYATSSVWSQPLAMVYCPYITSPRGALLLL